MDFNTLPFAPRPTTWLPPQPNQPITGAYQQASRMFEDLEVSLDDDVLTMRARNANPKALQSPPGSGTVTSWSATTDGWCVPFVYLSHRILSRWR
jgi:hypothetical protein